MTAADSIARLVAGIADDNDLATLIEAARAGRLVVIEKTPEAERRARLPERDDAIRRYARLYLTFLPPTVAAKKLADHLAGNVDVSSEQRVPIVQIIELNGGEPLGWSQIHNILKGRRER